MPPTPPERPLTRRTSGPFPLVSATLESGAIVEMVYRPKGARTAFVIWERETWRYADRVELGPGRPAVPYSPHNNLIRHEVVLFPSGPEEYGSEAELLGEIQAFVHRYVDVGPLFEKIATYYVLLSWIYDGFNELPYLRREVSPTREFNPRAYAVFGPKLVATRRPFEDRALESRCITEEMGQSKLREDVPINMPATHKEEALRLRNKL